MCRISEPHAQLGEADDSLLAVAGEYVAADRNAVGQGDLGAELPPVLVGDVADRSGVEPRLEGRPAREGESVDERLPIPAPRDVLGDQGHRGGEDPLWAE